MDFFSIKGILHRVYVSSTSLNIALARTSPLYRSRRLYVQYVQSCDVYVQTCGVYVCSHVVYMCAVMWCICVQSCDVYVCSHVMYMCSHVMYMCAVM